MADKKQSTPRKVGRPRIPILDEANIAVSLAQTSGNVSATAKKFKVDRSSVQHFIDKSPHLQQILRDAREGMLDEAETAMMKAIRKGEAWSVCFSLKTQGRSRGYSERTEDLPPLEVLLAAIRPDDAAVVRAALADAVQRRSNPGGVHPPGADETEAVRPAVDAAVPPALPQE